MAKNELRLIITADGKRALDTIDATERNIKSLGSQTLKLEQDLKSGIERTAGMADAFRQMNDVVNRYAISMNELNPAISQNEAALKAWKAMMESVITKGGAFGSETLEYIKMQIASVSNEIEKQNTVIAKTTELEKVTNKAVNAQLSYKSAVEKTNPILKYFKKNLELVKNVMGFRIVMTVINNLAQLSQFFKESTQAAAEAEQKFSKLNTVFGKTSNAMSKAISLASKLGVATSTAASSLSTVGDLLQAQGMYTTESLETAYEWISQFQDIIAFKDINMSLEEFAQNFMSGAAGNLRNFRTFGSIVRESSVNAELAKKGLDKLTGSELELAKMTTRAEMALEQQKNAIGATQREWDTMLSVQRRYEEAMIKFQENLGNSLNPVIKMWMQLKTVMLEVFTAQQTWNEKQKMVEEKKALDTKYATFGKDGDIVNQSNYLGFRSYIDAANTAYVNASSSEKKQLKVLNDLMISIQEYGATVPDLTRTFADIVKSGGAIDSDFWIQAVDYASDYLLKLQEIKKEEEDINNLLSKANQADSFFEQIQAIKGIDLTNVSFYNAFIEALDKANGNGITDKEALFFGLGDAKLDIDKLGLSLIEKTFSSDPFLETLEKRRDTYKELYEIAVNSGKYQEEDVQFIAEEWKNANKQIDDYIEKKDLLSSLSSGTADYTKQIEQLGMSEFEKTIDDLNRMLEGVTDKDIISAINAQIEAFTKLTEATNEYNAEQEMKKKWEDLGTQASDSLGEFGTLISSFGSGGMPDLLSTLVQIVSQTEAFTRLSSILTDSILPVLNAFLEPIIPLIDQLSSIISNLAQSVLIPFFPILQGISAAIAGLFGVVDATFSAIASSIKWTMGWALGWIEDAVNTVVGWFGGGKADWGFIDWRNENPGQVFKDKINKTNDTIEKILGYSMEIADNTSDNDFDTYKKLLLAKEINQETYNKWTGMDRYTTQSLANGVSYTTGNRSYVNVNNLTVQVPEGMTLAEFLKGIDDYNNGHGLYSVNTLVS